jgi:hypothetical protein
MPSAASHPAHGRHTLAPSPFPTDAGDPDPMTRRALAVAQARPSVETYLSAVAALCLDRLLVPVVATATHLGSSAEDAVALGTDGGWPAEKEAEMSVVTIADPQGRRAFLAFTGLDALQAWDARARPVPVTLDLAAQAAAAEGAEALVVDVAGPAPAVIDGEVLAGLAQGHRLVALDDGGFGWAVPTPAD